MSRRIVRLLLLAGLSGMVPVSALAAEDGRTIALPPEQWKLLGIATAEAVPAHALATGNLVGEVQLPLAGSVAVASTYAGRVSTVAVDEGDAVTAGQTLAVVVSREYAAERAALARKRAESDLARRQAQRDAGLLDAGVIPAARAEASSAARDAAVAELAALEATVGQVAASAAGPAAFRLTAPVAGRVIERRIAPGDPVDALAVAFVIAGDDGWRLEAGVPVALARSIGAGAALQIGAIRAPVTGRAAGIDPATQTVRVRAKLPAGSGLAPGQRVAVTLALPAPPGALAVPRAALSRIAGRVQVFVRRGGAFHPVTVQVLGEDGALAVVRGPLRSGEPVVIAGVSALKAQMDR
ncbi:MAG: efflux RND transporter periplasmic adaptor subunit [Gammaproteobacteria bacterium]